MLNDVAGIIEAGGRLYARGSVAGSDGNISIRKGNVITATRSGVCKGFLKTGDLCKLTLDGKLISGKNPSGEIKMHIAIYKTRADISAVIHGHPPFATAFAAMGKPLDKMIISEAAISPGKIPLAPYKTTGTKELAEAVAKLFAGHDAVLMEKHGLTVCGKTLERALFNFETAEHLAKIAFITERMGGAKGFEKEETAKLRNIGLSL